MGPHKDPCRKAHQATRATTETHRSNNSSTTARRHRVVTMARRRSRCSTSRCLRRYAGTDGETSVVVRADSVLVSAPH